LFVCAPSLSIKEEEENTILMRTGSTGELLHMPKREGNVKRKEDNPGKAKEKGSTGCNTWTKGR